MIKYVGLLIPPIRSADCPPGGGVRLRLTLNEVAEGYIGGTPLSPLRGLETPMIFIYFFIFFLFLSIYLLNYFHLDIFIDILYILTSLTIHVFLREKAIW